MLFVVMFSCFRSLLNKRFAILVSSVLMSSCATIFSGTTQDLSIKVVDSTSDRPLEAVSCKVTDSRGYEYSVPSNPGSVNIKKGSGTLSIVCHKKGYRQVNMAIGDSFSAVAAVNILFLPGLAVDAITGAWKEYPSHYVVMMEPLKDRP